MVLGRVVQLGYVWWWKADLKIALNPHIDFDCWSLHLLVHWKLHACLFLLSISAASSSLSLGLEYVHTRLVGLGGLTVLYHMTMAMVVSCLNVCSVKMAFLDQAHWPWFWRERSRGRSFWIVPAWQRSKLASMMFQIDLHGQVFIGSRYIHHRVWCEVQESDGGTLRGVLQGKGALFVYGIQEEDRA